MTLSPDINKYTMPHSEEERRGLIKNVLNMIETAVYNYRLRRAVKFCSEGRIEDATQEQKRAMDLLNKISPESVENFSDPSNLT